MLLTGSCVAANVADDYARSVVFEEVLYNEGKLGSSIEHTAKSITNLYHLISFDYHLTVSAINIQFFLIRMIRRQIYRKDVYKLVEESVVMKQGAGNGTARDTPGISPSYISD